MRIQYSPSFTIAHLKDRGVSGSSRDVEGRVSFHILPVVQNYDRRHDTIRAELEHMVLVDSNIGSSRVCVGLWLISWDVAVRKPYGGQEPCSVVFQSHLGEARQM